VNYLKTLRRHRSSKLWLLTVAVGLLLVFSAAAVRNTAPDRWEYKTIWFRVNAGDDMNELQTRFTTALNREASRGWEYAGRCGHTNSLDAWVDFIVFKRPRI